jgi:hypothetical protein
MKKVFTTNWYLQKVYFASISMNQDHMHKRTAANECLRKG